MRSTDSYKGTNATRLVHDSKIGTPSSIGGSAFALQSFFDAPHVLILLVLHLLADPVGRHLLFRVGEGGALARVVATLREAGPSVVAILVRRADLRRRRVMWLCAVTGRRAERRCEEQKDPLPGRARIPHSADIPQVAPRAKSP